MIHRIKEAISNRLLELYTDVTIYDEETPVEGETLQNGEFSLEEKTPVEGEIPMVEEAPSITVIRPYFLITLTNQGYTKLLSNKSKVELAFDITYYSNHLSGIRNDCIQVGQALLSNFESLLDYRVLAKKVEVKESVLHFTFSLQYLEMKLDTPIFMNKKEVNTNI